MWSDRRGCIPWGQLSPDHTSSNFPEKVVALCLALVTHPRWLAGVPPGL